jgi:hypothetical protein
LFATSVVDKTGGKFASGVVDTGGNLPLASLTPVTNLPPVSLTPVANSARYQQHQRNWWQNLPLVWLIMVVHFDLQIFPRIFEKI